jgi:hypothetical protein
MPQANTNGSFDYQFGIHQDNINIYTMFDWVFVDASPYVFKIAPSKSHSLGQLPLSKHNSYRV